MVFCCLGLSAMFQRSISAPLNNMILRYFILKLNLFEVISRQQYILKKHCESKLNFEKNKRLLVLLFWSVHENWMKSIEIDFRTLSTSMSHWAITTNFPFFTSTTTRRSESQRRWWKLTQIYCSKDMVNLDSLQHSQSHISMLASFCLVNSFVSSGPDRYFLFHFGYLLQRERGVFRDKTKTD